MHIILAVLEQKDAENAENPRKKRDFLFREHWLIGTAILWMLMDNPCFFLTNVSGLWLDCPALQPFKVLFLSPALPPKSRCFRHLKAP